MGVAVYRLVNADIRLRTSIAVAFFLMPPALLCAYMLDRAWHLDSLGISLFGDRVGHSQVFLPATIFGVAVAVNMLSFPSLEKYLAPLLMRAAAPIQWLAGATLSIYLFHHPLLHMFGAVVRVGKHSPFWVNLIILVFTLLCCIALSTVTEAKKRPLGNLLLRALSLAGPISAPDVAQVIVRGSCLKIDRAATT
jgi:peptidoglycan/LPS O-acetylase OafA/YrhL